MTASVHIHSGSWPRPRLGTFQTARNVNRGWRLGDFTGASFEVSCDDDAFSILAERDLLSLGNMVVIEETGFPSWVGFIEKDTWGLKATGVSVQCKEAAQLLQERKTPKQFLVTENTSSAVRRLLLEANLQNPTGIFATTLEPGCLATVDLSSVSVADALDSLCQISGQEWWVEPAISPGKVELTLHVSSARGEDKSGSIVLREGQLVDAKYVLDAKNIVASLTIVGSGGSFAMRPAATVSVGGKAENAQQSAESASVAGQTLVANAAQIARLLPWLGPATARDLVSVSPQLSDDQTIAGLAVSRLDREYRGPEEVEAVVSLSGGALAGVNVGDTIGLEAASLGPSGISKSFRVQEMAVDEGAGTVTVRGHTEGGLTPRRGLRGLLRGIQASVRDLQRSSS